MRRARLDQHTFRSQRVNEAEVKGQCRYGPMPYCYVHLVTCMEQSSRLTLIANVRSKMATAICHFARYRCVVTAVHGRLGSEVHVSRVASPAMRTDAICVPLAHTSSHLISMIGSVPRTRS
ncbi:unnamed protein product, partial [Iphiclides podalirius]